MISAMAIRAQYWSYSHKIDLDAKWCSSHASDSGDKIYPPS